MAGRGRGHGQGGGQGRGQGGDVGQTHGDSQERVDQPGGFDGRPGAEEDDVEGGEDSLIRHGRSEDSPGHRKQAAGAQSARDFAPGRARRD